MIWLIFLAISVWIFFGILAFRRTIRYWYLQFGDVEVGVATFMGILGPFGYLVALSFFWGQVGKDKIKIKEKLEPLILRFSGIK